MYKMSYGSREKVNTLDEVTVQHERIKAECFMLAGWQQKTQSPKINC